MEMDFQNIMPHFIWKFYEKIIASKADFEV